MVLSNHLDIDITKEYQAFITKLDTNLTKSIKEAEEGSRGTVLLIPRFFCSHTKKNDQGKRKNRPYDHLNK